VFSHKNRACEDQRVNICLFLAMVGDDKKRRCGGFYGIPNPIRGDERRGLLPSRPTHDSVFSLLLGKLSRLDSRVSVVHGHVRAHILAARRTFRATLARPNCHRVFFDELQCYTSNMVLKISTWNHVVQVIDGNHLLTCCGSLSCHIYVRNRISDVLRIEK